VVTGSLSIVVVAATVVVVSTGSSAAEANDNRQAAATQTAATDCVALSIVGPVGSDGRNTRRLVRSGLVIYVFNVGHVASGMKRYSNRM